MKKSVKGFEAIPHNAVEFVVRSERQKYAQAMYLTFEGLVNDPHILEILRKELDASSMQSRFSIAMSRFAMTDAEGTTSVYDTSKNWGKPKFDGNKITFMCWGDPFVAESVAEAFEIYLHSIVGTYCYVVPQ